MKKEAKINMKNTKLTVGLIACLLSVGGLAGCSKVRSSSDGVLLTYKVDGKEYPITAKDILEKSYDDSSKYQAIYDIIYSVLVKNYFNHDYTVNYYGKTETLGKKQMGNVTDEAYGSEGSIYGKARQKVNDDLDTAQSNADANNTKYKKELETILTSKGVKTEEELFDKYVEEIQKETFEKNFYTYYVEDLKLGAGATDGKDSLKGFWSGYFADQMPYHVSHILVKVDDGAGTNYANGTISEANATKLSKLLEALASGKDDFKEIAYNYSEDSGSRVLRGDLGIMDTSTSFVNEFKLGIYAYENLFGDVDSKATAKDKIKMDTELRTKYNLAVADSFDTAIPTISKAVFDKLGKVADVETDKDNKPVLEGSANFYPRNVIYNKYLNRHSFAFVEGTADDVHGATATTGYHKYESGALKDKVILSAKVSGVWRPILVVRAGSDYQGIHFIVVNRSPYDSELNGVSQTNYYTTFYPDQKSIYPKDASGEPIKSYVNFSSSNTDVSATKKRAEELASKLKSFDSDRLSKYIFKKYLEDEGVTIQQAHLKDQLFKWIDASILKAEDEREENWSKTWTEYIDSLARQGDERSKLIPQACGIVYSKANTSEKLGTTLEAAISDFSAEAKAVIRSEIAHYLSVKLNKVVEVDDADYIAYCDSDIADIFKLEGGLCNDGKTHL